jgi:CheY-like chemotaxis protein
MNSVAYPNINILLVEDNPGDVRLTKEALKEGKIINTMSVASDGEEAMSILRQEGKYADFVRPDLVLLDLNMPKMDGREVLKAMKTEPSLKSIPVVVLTTSKADNDILQSYEHHANCYISKPVELEQFIEIVENISDFWFSVVKLPSLSNV